MDINDNRIEKKILDGKEYLFPDRDAWAELERKPKIDGKEIFDLDNALKYKKITDKHSDLFLGLYLFSRRNKWLPCIFFKIDDYLQRVHLEKIRCNECSWQGMTANPLVAELYFGLPDEDELFQKAGNYEVKLCPGCSCRLPRYPIWIENK